MRNIIKILTFKGHSCLITPVGRGLQISKVPKGIKVQLVGLLIQGLLPHLLEHIGCGLICIRDKRGINQKL